MPGLASRALLAARLAAAEGRSRRTRGSPLTSYSFTPHPWTAAAALVTMAANGKHKSYIVEVAPARPAANGKPASGPVYRAAIAKDGPPKMNGIDSLYEMFMASVQKFGDRPCLGKREGGKSPYTWLTYKEAAEHTAAIASGLVASGLGPHGRVGVYGANSPEWMLAMQACNRQNLYCVPLYDSLGENAIEFIINHSETSAVFVQTEKLAMLVKALPKSPGVKLVVYWGKGDAAAAKAAADAGVKTYSFDEFLALGRASLVPPSPPKATDLCTIMYTSGTTGDPKGVEITHEAVMSVVASMKAFLECEWVNESMGPGDYFFSFLPLAHIFDRAAEELMLCLGASIGYWQGDIKLLMDDVAALRPTLFCGVPRVFDRVYSGVFAKVKEGSFLKRALFNWGYSRKLHYLMKGAAYDKAAPLFDKIIFNKIKDRLGGRVRLVISGGAPLARHVEDFLKVAMCCKVVQGYGLTETCAASFIAVPEVPEQSGTVGPPQPVLSFRLEAVPEMNYDPMANPPRGELVVKGPSVFVGYYKQPEKTAADLEADGWFHTGDIAEIQPCGSVRIIDRKKNIFKLSQGEYIAVEKVEGIYKMNSNVEQIWVYGNSFESCLVAVVVPTHKALRDLGKEAGAPASASDQDLCRNAGVKKGLLASLTQTAKEGKLKGFEQVKAIYLESPDHAFSVDNELLTPTFKLKRPQLFKHYEPEVTSMYAALK